MAVAAKAEDGGQQSQQACINDAITICAQFIPDRERIAECLIKNQDRISIPCRAQLAHWHG
jgi:hypothetical protein